MTAAAPSEPAGPHFVLLGLRRVLLVSVLLVAAALGSASAATAAPPPGRWDWPLPAPARVVAPADLPAENWLPGHRGIDLIGQSGTVTAVDDGTVTFAGPVAGRPVVSVAHAGGLVSSYDPVAPQVVTGQQVRRGQVIGILPAEHGAASHCAPRLCLHLGARLHGTYIDPMPLLGPPRPSVLKPWGGLTPGSSLSGARVGLVEAGPQSLR